MTADPLLALVRETLRLAKRNGYMRQSLLVTEALRDNAELVIRSVRHAHDWTLVQEPDVYACECGATMSGDLP